MESNGSLVFRILTLNCWGLLYVSKHRLQRIKSISNHINEQNYDFVFLQEIWCQSDFDYIRTTTKSKYKFAHQFKTTSVLGNSGLVILSKWEPSFIHFEPFIVNGSPFRPWHGDWFVGKGVAYVRIHVADINIHLFGCHMHAQYAPDEDVHSQYSIHRICQAYQLAKFINLIGSSFTQPSFRDLFILAGDLNTASNDLPYRLLVQMTGLTDSYKKYAVHRECDLRSELNIEFAAKYFVEDINLTTCGHHSNTFTGPADKDQAKRIDFIMYKLLQHPRLNVDNYICTSDRVECLGKDMGDGLSYSDHQPVAIQLKLRAPDTTSIKEFTEDLLDESPSPKKVFSIEVNSKCVVGAIGDSGDGLDLDISAASDKDASTALNVTECKTFEHFVTSRSESIRASSEVVTRNRIKKTSNVSLELTDVGRKSLGSISAELKKVALAAASKLYPLNRSHEREAKFSFNKETWYLHRSYQLVESYLTSSFTTGQRWFFYLMSVIFGILSINLGSKYIFLSLAKMYSVSVIYTVVALILIIFVEMIHRFEQNAITSISDDMRCTLHILEKVDEPKLTPNNIN